MKVLQRRIFNRRVKKPNKDEKATLDQAVKLIIKDPTIGLMKKGDLGGVQVHKYKHQVHEMLLAYRYDNEAQQLTLLAFGSHENFYRDLKR